MANTVWVNNGKLVTANGKLVLCDHCPCDLMGCTLAGLLGNVAYYRWRVEVEISGVVENGFPGIAAFINQRHGLPCGAPVGGYSDEISLLVFGGLTHPPYEGSPPMSDNAWWTWEANWLTGDSGSVLETWPFTGSGIPSAGGLTFYDAPDAAAVGIDVSAHCIKFVGQPPRHFLSFGLYVWDDWASMSDAIGYYIQEYDHAPTLADVAAFSGNLTQGYNNSAGIGTSWGAKWPDCSGASFAVTAVYSGDDAQAQCCSQSHIDALWRNNADICCEQCPDDCSTLSYSVSLSSPAGTLFATGETPGPLSDSLPYFGACTLRTTWYDPGWPSSGWFVEANLRCNSGAWLLYVVYSDASGNHYVWSITPPVDDSGLPVADTYVMPPDLAEGDDPGFNLTVELTSP